MTGRKYDLFIEGRYGRSATDRRLERRSPVTGELVATYAGAGTSEVVHGLDGEWPQGGADRGAEVSIHGFETEDEAVALDNEIKSVILKG